MVSPSPLTLSDDAIGAVAADPAVARRHLTLIAEATDRLMAADDPRAMIDSLFTLIRDELRLDFYFNYRRDDATTRLEASGGLSRDAWQAAARLDIEETACGLAMRERRSLHLTDIQASRDPRTAFVRSLGIQVYLCIPLFHGSQVLGTLGFGRTAPLPFDEDERRLLALLCHYVSLAKHRLRIEEALREGLETQSRLLAELNHRVRNALQVAIGLVTHQIGTAVDASARAALSRAVERLQVLASAHRPLYATAAPGLVDLPALFREVIAQVRGEAAERAVDAVDRIAVSIERAVGAALLLDALLAHDDDGGAPQIGMRLDRRDGNEMLELSFQGSGWGGRKALIDHDRLVARLCHQLRATPTSEDDGCLILVMPYDGSEYGHRNAADG